MNNRIPQPIIEFSESGMMISDLVNQRHGYSQTDYPWARKMLGKFPIPTWQRESVWTLAQKVSFIESCYLGYDIGSIVVNGYQELENNTLAEYSDCLIDGQQRVESMLDYTQDKFKVFGLFYSALSRSEQARFLYRELGKRTTNCFDEEKLKAVYNHLNFSGTNHRESERA
ncbi:conserved hypothetical protein [Vibrio nigripulchritudo SOn1]|uniref:GmrSD restriction endonucleases N-terminal domain-containing protein n=1 Tax=Vibrio nigripulchritudo SOn1 TaxID=1238450 RepID=A0AAV2VHS1_9VIBR|nr:DUF262 domain-containing protein [Vibrio nigripulchritudo]CCO44212.1 conserved hypothetical protein [Vibrio nigripulchritudo SOn1]